MSIPAIYKGDDTDFRDVDGFKIRLSLAEDIDITDCTVEVVFHGVSRRFPAVPGSETVYPVKFTAAETARFPLGVSFARVRVWDAESRVRTIMDTVRIKVTDSVMEAYGTGTPQELVIDIGGEALPEIPEDLSVTDDDSVLELKKKFNSVLSLFRKTATPCIAALLSLPVFGADPAYTSINNLPGTAEVVMTNTEAFVSAEVERGVHAATSSVPEIVSNTVPGIVSSAVPSIVTNMARDIVKEVSDAALLAVYYPEGNVTSVEQITTNGLEYSYNDTTLTATLSNGKSATGDIVIPWKVVKDGKEYKVTAVGNRAFFDSEFSHGANITSVIAPATVTSIDREAFMYCFSLTSISLPSVASIGVFAFDSCNALKSVSLPSVTRVGSGAFYICNNLTSVSLPFATVVESSVFSMCLSLTNVSLPSATRISGSAFSGCTNLTSVSVPSVTIVGYNAFSSCTALKSIDFGATPRDSIPALEGDVFDNVPTSCKIIVPLGMYDEWIAADGWRDLYADGYNFMGYADAAKVVSAPVVTNIVRTIISTSGRYMWDEEASVCYRLNVQNGFLDLVAVTNIDLTLPENYEALEAMESKWRAK